MWPKMQHAYSGDEYVVKIRDREIRTKLTHTSLSGSKIRKVALPHYEDHGELLKWLLLENVPGSFPYTAGGGESLSSRRITTWLLSVVAESLERAY